MAENNPVCVLIPTLATPERAALLLRAIGSIRAQAPIRPRIIVIVNGPRADATLLRTLPGLPDLRVLRIAEASMPEALAAGRSVVDTEFFTELDDDDELMPGALAVRARRMAEPDRPDAVITNTILRGEAAEKLVIDDITAVRRDPLGTLLTRNWLAPGAAMFRSESMPVKFFRDMPRYLEWTYLGLVLASTSRLAFIAEPTVVHYIDHPFSVDRSRECLLGRPEAIARLLTLDLPARARRLLRAKRAAAYHQLAQIWLAEGRPREAWQAHLRSLGSPAGWRYLLYTRRLPLGSGRCARVTPEVPGG
jgi:hypothetical protein